MEMSIEPFLINFLKLAAQIRLDATNISYEAFSYFIRAAWCRYCQVVRKHNLFFTL